MFIQKILRTLSPKAADGAIESPSLSSELEILRAKVIGIRTPDITFREASDVVDYICLIVQQDVITTSNLAISLMDVDLAFKKYISSFMVEHGSSSYVLNEIEAQADLLDSVWTNLIIRTIPDQEYSQWKAAPEVDANGIKKLKYPPFRGKPFEEFGAVETSKSYLDFCKHLISQSTNKLDYSLLTRYRAFQPWEANDEEHASNQTE